MTQRVSSRSIDVTTANDNGVIKAATTGTLLENAIANSHKDNWH